EKYSCRSTIQKQIKQFVHQGKLKQKTRQNNFFRSDKSKIERMMNRKILKTTARVPMLQPEDQTDQQCWLQLQQQMKQAVHPAELPSSLHLPQLPQLQESQLRLE